MATRSLSPASETDPWSHRAVLVEARRADVDAQVEHLRLAQHGGAHPRAAGIVGVHGHLTRVRECHDLLDLVDGQGLVRHGQPGQHDQVDLWLAVERLREGLQPHRVDETGPDMCGSPRDRRMAIAHGHADHRAPGSHHHHVRREGGGTQAVEHHDVVAVRPAAEVLQRHLGEPLPEYRRGQLVIEEGHVVGVDAQPALEPREVEDGVDAVLLDPRLDDLPGVAKLVKSSSVLRKIVPRA